MERDVKDGKAIKHGAQSQEPADNSMEDVTACAAITDEVGHRLAELEIKASFAEDLLDHLNAQVARQQEQIELLMREMMRLRQEQPAGESGARSLRDELPPHY